MHDKLCIDFPEWPREVIYLFAKTRTFIRIKYLNNDYLFAKKRTFIRIKYPNNELKADEAKAKQKGQFQY